jgi:hypothetical protein
MESWAGKLAVENRHKGLNDSAYKFDYNQKCLFKNQNIRH